jgi:hypothetical protein
MKNRNISIDKHPKLDTFLEDIEVMRNFKEGLEDQVFSFIEGVIKAIEESGIADDVEPELNKVQNSTLFSIMHNLKKLAEERMGDVEGPGYNKILQTLQRIKLGSDVDSSSQSSGSRIPSNPAHNRSDI